MSVSQATETDNLKKERDELNDEYLRLRQRANSLEQSMKNRGIEIAGYPVTPNECLINIVAKIGCLLGCKITETDISSVYRQPNRKNRIPVIIVSFTRQLTQQEYVNKSKDRIWTYASEFGFSSNNKIYINPSLTKFNNNLLYQSRLLKNQSRIKFAWTKGGKIFVRETDGSEVIQVTDEKDLNRFRRRSPSDRTSSGEIPFKRRHV